MPEDRRVESREEADRRRHIGRRPRRAGEIEELAPALIGEAAQSFHRRERGADVWYAHAAPASDVRYRRRAERAEMSSDHEGVRGFGPRLFPQAWRRRDMARELAMLEMRTGALPDEPARRDRGPEQPVAQPLVRGAARHVIADVLEDLRPAPRRGRREGEDALVELAEIAVRLASGRPPRAEPAFERRQRV